MNVSKTEFIVFRSPHLRCDLSGLSVYVGESHITQSLKVRDLGVTFDQFFILIFMIILQLYVDAHIFILETLEKLGIYHRIMLVLLLFMHLLVVGYGNYLLYNVPMHKTDRMKRLQNQCARILTTSPRREHITPV